MINNMYDFRLIVSKLKIELLKNGQNEYANKLETALIISQSALEVTGETKRVIQELEQKKISKKFKLEDDIFLIKKFIDLYW